MNENPDPSPTTPRRPRLGDTVLWRANGSPLLPCPCVTYPLGQRGSPDAFCLKCSGTGTYQTFPSVDRVAIVTATIAEVPRLGNAFCVSLCVLNPTGVFFQESSGYGETPEPNRWRFRPDAPDDRSGVTTWQR